MPGTLQDLPLTTADCRLTRETKDARYRYPDLPTDHSTITTMKDTFWETTPLGEMTPTQWESLCDGCGKCCLQKYEDEDTGRMVYTNVACFLLDLDTCACSDYQNRSIRVPDCITLVPKVLEDPYWLPETCAYRLVAEGKPLPQWHPLLSKDPASVLCADHSISGRVVSEHEADDPLQHLIDWIR